MYRIWGLIGIVFFGCQGSLPRGLDTSFGTNGKLTTAFGSQDDEALSVAIQSDGKIIVAGRSYSNGRADFAIARYETTGTLDTTFGTGGLVTTDFSGGDDIAYSITVLSDGTILAAGTVTSGVTTRFGFAKYGTTGSLDTNFDSDGKLLVSIGSQDNLRAVSIASNGSIVAAGFSKVSSTYDMSLVMISSTGNLVTDFDTDGKKTVAIGTGDDKAFAMAIQSDGKIVIAGSTASGSTSQFAVLRLSPSGELDTGFASNGVQTVASGSQGTVQDIATGVGILADDSIAVTGTSDNGTAQSLFATRLSSTGSLMSDFSDDGKLLARFSTESTSISSQGTALVIQNNNLLLAGHFISTAGTDFGLLRVDSSGAVDSSFGSNGAQTLDFGSTDEATGVALTGGSIIVVGRAYNGSNYDFAVAKYL